MTTKAQTNYSKDLKNKKMTVVREFAAPPEQVWQAWTDSKLLDQWWAPKPWKARTKSMDFREGGYWLYSMEGPDGSKHWARADYKKIIPSKMFVGTDAFCDENGVINTDLPGMEWKVEFNKVPNGTRVDIEITFQSEADMEKIVEMGFQEGFSAAHNNLDELLAK